MTRAETRKLKIGTYVRIKFDDGAQDGILMENYKDDNYVKVFIPSDESLQTIERDQIYKAGKRIDFNFNESGLWG